MSGINIWTRDISYSIHLALAHIDPKRAKTSFEFKTSELKTCGDLHIIFRLYTGGKGGKEEIYNRVNIAQVRLLFITK